MFESCENDFFETRCILPNLWGNYMKKFHNWLMCLKVLKHHEIYFLFSDTFVFKTVV